MIGYEDMLPRYACDRIHAAIAMTVVMYGLSESFILLPQDSDVRDLVGAARLAAHRLVGGTETHRDSEMICRKAPRERIGEVLAAVEKLPPRGYAYGRIMETVHTALRRCCDLTKTPTPDWLTKTNGMSWREIWDMVEVDEKSHRSAA